MISEHDFQYKGMMNGANLLLTITKSLVQENDEKIFLLPAWNKKLDVFSDSLSAIIILT